MQRDERTERGRLGMLQFRDCKDRRRTGGFQWRFCYWHKKWLLRPSPILGAPRFRLGSRKACFFDDGIHYREHRAPMSQDPNFWPPGTRQLNSRFLVNLELTVAWCSHFLI